MWDERYSASELVWSAGPNMFVEEHGRGLEPGRMIDLGAGEARNALWFAEQGWDATAVDYSAVGIDKANQIADQREVDLTTLVADLTTYVPESGGYDLVLLAYIHMAPEDRATILTKAASAVATGGYLLLVGHDATNLEHGYGGPQSAEVLTSPGEVVAGLGDSFEIIRAEVADREVATDVGPTIAKDTVVFAQRAN
jgi:SAM-dependent methyltransferase